MKLSFFKTGLYLLLVGLSLACNKTPPIEDTMLDSNNVFDPSLNNPSKYLVSAKYPNPTPDDLKKHVIIAIHGYSATTFEWDEFREWSKDSSYRVSEVLLGGHGRTYEAFKASKWEDWLESIVREYDKLDSLGYKKISLVGSSTAGTLILKLIQSGYFKKHPAPKNVFFIDAIVVPSSKLQSIVGIVGPMFVYFDTGQTKEDDLYWYHFRPQETITELNKLMQSVRHDLETGFSLPQDTYMKVFHSKQDPVANSLSAPLIYKGLTRSNGAKIEVQIMDSEIHVFTRLSLRTTVSALERANQQDAFRQMAQKLY
jgi:carboxylesterase